MTNGEFVNLQIELEQQMDIVAELQKQYMAQTGRWYIHGQRLKDEEEAI